MTSLPLETCHSISKSIHFYCQIKIKPSPSRLHPIPAIKEARVATREVASVAVVVYYVASVVSLAGQVVHAIGPNNYIQRDAVPHIRGEGYEFLDPIRNWH